MSSGRPALDRLGYLRAVGGAVAAPVCRPAARWASEYDTVTVPAGKAESFSIGSGETLEHKLIDITAKGADCRIHADGDDWAIRNVGLTGTVPERDTPTVSVSGHTGEIRNVYLGDGGRGATGAAVGLYVGSNLTGELSIERCHVANWPDNGIYASPPGTLDVPPFSDVGDVGEGGAVDVEDSYFANNHVARVRFGTTGSYAENCVVTGGPHRGFWVPWERVTFIDCESTATVSYDAGGNVTGDGYEKHATAVGALVDCRGNGRTQARGGARLIGSQRPNPEVTPPAGVPTSAAEAARGVEAPSGSESGRRSGH